MAGCASLPNPRVVWYLADLQSLSTGQLNPLDTAECEGETLAKHHVIISGTGRAGTTFLVQLLTALKLDTGFDNPAAGMHPNCNAGMELDITRGDAPYILKDPFLCDYLDKVIEEYRVVIDHAVIPVRDLYSAAQSRRAVEKNADPVNPHDKVLGGLVHTKVPEEQELVLAQMFHNLFFVMAKHDIPVTLLHFPRFVNDPAYLYKKIRFLLPNTSYDEFLQGFREVARPELVHNFEANQPSQYPEALQKPASVLNVLDRIIEQGDAEIARRAAKRHRRKLRKIYMYAIVLVFVVGWLVYSFLPTTHHWFK